MGFPVSDLLAFYRSMTAVCWWWPHRIDAVPVCRPATDVWDPVARGAARWEPQVSKPSIVDNFTAVRGETYHANSESDFGRICNASLADRHSNRVLFPGPR
ncbi:hypothetical protein K505DRAFT_369077 [Melanomma pulvis-pyrius CBS 109.77]|uniref:Uncharacterized protein n=1 Tax=Melanomma pulvis-pyrius CBS 109.77 TaxID=1314802 RepID=A0A6A6WNA6_9PLEO|nr:hypothetical protein K505DRAFT_369077 [Melanomma pulvis-pyrius CBS 109.77]